MSVCVLCTGWGSLAMHQPLSAALHRRIIVPQMAGPYEYPVTWPCPACMWRPDLPAPQVTEEASRG